jgi:hypothetical protein
VQGSCSYQAAKTKTLYTIPMNHFKIHQRFFSVLVVLICFYHQAKPQFKNTMNNEELFLSALKKNEIITNELSIEDRRYLLRKLEDYIKVLGTDTIGPMYFNENEKNPFAAESFVNEYKELKFNQKLNERAAREIIQKKYSQSVIKILIALCELNLPDNANTEMYLAEINEPFILEYLFDYLKEQYFKENGAYTQMSKLTREQNLLTLASRLDILDTRTYVFYQNYNSKPRFMKGFELLHENDFLFMALNQDREMTGGFKFTLVTDYFKWRWINILSLKCLRECFHVPENHTQNLLTYQTISLLGRGYTPYIRYRNNYTLADSIHNYDRPFASYYMLERAKKRIWRNGLFRHKGEFQIGAIGISQGRKIQAKLHEDLVTSSQYVHGWDKQIGNGGRMIIQLNQKIEALLYSNTNRYSSIFKAKNYKREESKKYCGRNIIAEVEASVGTLLTAAGFGLRFSTLNFLQQSGDQMVSSVKGNRDEFGIKFDVGVNYRYVFHNSTLTGVGILKTFEADLYDKEKKDNYLLKEKDVERHIYSLDLGINVKFRKTTFFFRETFYSLEYKSALRNIDFNNPDFIKALNPDDQDFYRNVVIKENRDFLNNKLFGRTFYVYGTIGFSWYVD